MNNIKTFDDKELKDCTREELIECIQYLNEQYEIERKRHEITRLLWESTNE